MISESQAQISASFSDQSSLISGSRQSDRFQCDRIGRGIPLFLDTRLRLPGTRYILTASRRSSSEHLLPRKVNWLIFVPAKGGMSSSDLFCSRIAIRSSGDGTRPCLGSFLCTSRMAAA